MSTSGNDLPAASAPSVDDDENSKTYDSVLSTVQKKVMVLTLISLVIPLMIATRFYIMEEYLQSISTWSTATIANVASAAFLVDAILGLAFGWLGDRYGYSVMLVLVYVMNSAGSIIESFAGTAPVFSVGLFAASISIFPLVIALAANMIPQRQYGKFLAFMYSLMGVVYLVGPFIAAVLADFVSMRAVYFLNAFVLCFCLFLMIYFMWNIEREVQALLQTSLSADFVAQQDPLDQFPLYFAAPQSNQGENPSKSILRDMDTPRLAALLIATVQNGLIWALECVLLFYAESYLSMKYPDDNITLLNVTSVYGMFLVFLVVGVTVTPNFIETVVPKRMDVIAWSTLAWMLCCIALYLNTSSIWTERLLMVVLGSSMGVAAILTEMSQVEIQPKQHSGAVEGFKIMLLALFRAICIFGTGYLWEIYEVNVIWIIFFVCAVVVLVLAIVRTSFLDVGGAELGTSCARIEESSGEEKPLLSETVDV